MKHESAGGSSHAGGSNSSSGQSPDNASSTTHQDAAKDVAKEAGAKANEMKNKVMEESKQARDELQSTASGLFSDLRGAVADQIDRFTEVLHGSEQEMKNQNLDEISTYPTVLAKHIEDVNEYLRERSGHGMRRDFERAIADQPVAVIGGLAAVGAITAWYLQSDQKANKRRDPSSSGDAPSGGEHSANGGEHRGRA